MKKLTILLFITLLCSCSASFSMGKQTATPEITKAEFEALVKQANEIFAGFEKRLQALEPKKAEKK